MPAPYPVSLAVDGRRCLVVGGGRVAARKVAGLLASGARVHVVATAVTEAVRSLAGAVEPPGALEWEERPYRAGEVAGFHLAVAATDREEVNRQVRRDGEEAGVWVNRADDAADSSFTLPAVLRRGDLVVTVATGGRSPALSAWLLDRLEREIGPEYEVLLDVVAAERAARLADGRRVAPSDWLKALDSGMLDLIRSGQVTEARERLQACLSSS